MNYFRVIANVVVINDNVSDLLQSRQWVDGSWVSGSNGSLLDGSHGSRVSARSPVTHVGILCSFVLHYSTLWSMPMLPCCTMLFLCITLCMMLVSDPLPALICCTL